MKVMNDLLSFNRMLTPRLISIVYFLLLLIVLISSIGLMFAGEQFLLGLLLLVFGAIAARVTCELLIVTFKINEALQDIRTSVR